MAGHRLLILIILSLAAAVVVAACTPGTVVEPATPTVLGEAELTPTPAPTAETTATATDDATETPVPETEAPGAALSVRQVLAQQLQVDPATISIVSAEPVEWPDSCLGVQIEGILCAQVITPGYRVVLEAEGEQYVFHTDQEGGSVVLAEGPAPEIEDGVINWSRTVAAICQTAVIGAEGIASGPCGGPTMAGQLVMPERREELDYLVNQFAPFTAETPAGTVAFSGQGSVTATPAEQRMVAEWAQLAALEAAAGRGGASWGLIFAWHREGGIAGFCEDVTVYVTGVAYASSCAGAEPQDLGRVRLNANQLAAAFNWVDTLQPFEYEHTDPATADAMTIHLVFSGAGNAEATEQDRLAMEALAVDVLAQATTETDEAGLAAARESLITYFDLLNQGEYATAAELYGGSYEILQGYNPDISPDDEAALFEAACTRSGLMCLVVRNIASEAQLSESDFRFTVEFQNADGNLFVLGPCCGATAEEMPPQSQFDYMVKQTEDGRFLVQEVPVYTP